MSQCWHVLEKPRTCILEEAEVEYVQVPYSGASPLCCSVSMGIVENPVVADCRTKLVKSLLEVWMWWTANLSY